MTAAKLFYKILVLEHLQSALLLQEHFFFFTLPCIKITGRDLSFTP